LACVDGIYNLQLVGGETLMVKDLPEIVDYAARTGKVAHIILITNGTMIPKKRLLSVMQKHKGIVQMLISDYSENEEIRHRLKIDQLIKTLENAGAAYVVVKSKDWVGVPKYTPDFDRERAKRHYAFEHRECLFHQTLHIIDGYLAVCPFHGFAIKSGLAEKIEPKEFIPLQELTAKSLYKWLAKPYYDLCGYCIIDCVPRLNAIQAEGMKCSR
jgi:wyosine [tRNA(Phe)-imidazoG37] synthetase (radical SAM superfamily)